MLNKRNQHKGKSRGKAKRAGRRGNGRIQDSLIRIPPVPMGRNFLAERVRSELTWSQNGTLNNVGVAYTGNYVNMNYPGIPVLGASTTPGGWTDLNGLYQSLRVLACKIKLEATNKEAFPVTIYLYRVGQTNAGGNTPAANDITSQNLLRAATENPTFRDKQLGIAASGRSSGIVSALTHLSNVIGTPWPGSVDEYSGTGNATTSLAPTALLYTGFGAFATDVATNFVNGVAYRLSVVFDCVFFQPRNQAS